MGCKICLFAAVEWSGEEAIDTHKDIKFVNHVKALLLHTQPANGQTTVGWVII